MLQRIRETRQISHLQIIGGNVATGAGARALAEAGCSAVKVARPARLYDSYRDWRGRSADHRVSDAVEALEGTVIPVITTAVSASPATRQLHAPQARARYGGPMLAGTEELPAKSNSTKMFVQNLIAGWASLGAMSKGSSDRYFQSDNAADKLVPPVMKAA